MSSPAPLLQGRGDSARVVIQTSAEATNADPAEAATHADIDTDDPDHRVNPLVAVIIGMAIMFGTLAILLALG